jgi:hypothetical protein
MPPVPPSSAEPGLFDVLSARLRAEGRALGDNLFGTRTTTAGAALQRPRKAALRIEPKTYFGALGEWDGVDWRPRERGRTNGDDAT